LEGVSGLEDLRIAAIENLLASDRLQENGRAKEMVAELQEESL